MLFGGGFFGVGGFDADDLEVLALGLAFGVGFGFGVDFEGHALAVVAGVGEDSVEHVGLQNMLRVPRMFLDVSVDGFGVGEAFLFGDAGGEGGGGVGGEDGDFFLEEDGAGVVGVVGEVDGAAGFFFAGAEDGFVDVVAVHAFAAEFGEECGVDVHDAVGEIVGDFPESEEAGHEGEIDGVVSEVVGDGGGEIFEGGEIFSGDDEGGEE